ncbi:major capsid protein [bacterium]|nr:major capsid protein [bacterium]
MPYVNWPSSDVATRLIRSFEPDPKRFIGRTILPLNAADYNKTPALISWNLLGSVSGMTHCHTLGTVPPIVSYRTLSKLHAEPAYFKEMIRLDEQDLININSADPAKAGREGEQLVTRALMDLNLRCDTRIELTTWQALQGSLTLNDNGITRVVDYQVLNKFSVGGGGFGPVWTAAGSNPISDLSMAAEVIRGSGGVTAYINLNTARVLINNEAIVDRVKQSTVVLQLDSRNIGQTLSLLVPGLEDCIVYNEGFLDWEGHWQTYIPDNTIILLGKAVPGTPLGEWASTPSLHNGGIANATGGKFAAVEDHINESNPRVDVFAGIYGLPVIFRPDWISVLNIGGPANAGNNNAGSNNGEDNNGGGGGINLDNGMGTPTDLNEQETPPATQVTDETVTYSTEASAFVLAHAPVVADSFTVKSADGQTTYVFNTDYTINLAEGKITSIQGTSMSFAENSTILVSYSYTAAS